MLLKIIRRLLKNFGANRIKYLFYAYSFANVLLLGLIILCLVYLFGLRNKLDAFSNDLNAELINLSDYKDFSLKLPGEKNFNESNFKFNSEESSASFSQKILSSKQVMIKIKESGNISDIHFVENINALVTDYENLWTENELLFGYLVELGNDDRGIYSKLISAAIDFRDKYQNASSTIKLSDEFSQILYSIQLLKNLKDESIIQNTQLKINKLLAQTQTLNQDSSDYMVVRVSDALHELDNYFKDYTRKLLEIGITNDKGLLQKLNLRYSKIEYRLKDSIKIITEVKKYRNYKALILLIILIFIVIIYNFLSLAFLIKREKRFKTSLSDFISEISLGKMPRFNKQEIPSEVLWLIDRIETFAKKSVNANIALTNLSMGNLSFEIDKQAHFEQYYLLLVKLKNTLENLNQQVQDEKKIHSQLIWIKNGIDKLTEVMRREYDNPLLHANEIINMLVDYLKIPVGAIYLYKEQEGKKFVEMASAFAYGKEKQLYKKIVFGEGIVGTAASERKTINVTNVPENYFNIVSGFGETKPKNIIASPIKLKDEIYGVIELASMTRFKDDEINFVEEVCKTVAFSFAISKVYLDTMYLYENTNLEVAQLQAENESLINDYEDINTNYKNLVINSSDNNFIVARLNELSVRLTLDLDGNILELNSRFEQLFRSDRKKLMQSNYRDFMTDAKFLEEIDFEYFWREIRAGVQQEIEMGIVISNQEFWLKQYFYPVKDEMGRVKKIQVISFDITDKIFLKNQLDSLKSE